MRILLWHVHGSWTTAFVQGPHTYLVPVTRDRGPDGRGRAETWDWPASVLEVPAEQLRDTAFDVVILQRPYELDLLRQWTGLRAGIDVTAVYVEHNTPAPHPVDSPHHLASRSDITVVHVTPFNDLYWDNGVAPTRVIEHGIPDPGYRWTGELARSAVVMNEPVRRHRIIGADLVGRLAAAGPVDVFGDRVTGLLERYALDPNEVCLHEGLTQEHLHDEMARRRVYVHTSRWTSLGLSLIEAMHLGMPIVAVAGTDAHRAVPPSAGVVSTDVGELCAATRRLLHDRSAAEESGRCAREWALAHHGLPAFIAAWDSLLEEKVA